MSLNPQGQNYNCKIIPDFGFPQAESPETKSGPLHVQVTPETTPAKE